VPFLNTISQSIALGAYRLNLGSIVLKGAHWGEIDEALVFPTISSACLFMLRTVNHRGNDAHHRDIGERDLVRRWYSCPN